ncbi:hypothetical protein HanPSC8_Chr04g0143191 [Helianthus annuus]|nr:hypothetical protein HanPSC8_Chr04g0143191 [Helianthus annuus]
MNAPVPSSLLGFGHLTFPFYKFTHLPSPSSSLCSLTPPVTGGGIPAPVYPVRRHAHTPNTLLDTPTPFVFTLSHTVFGWRAAEPTVLRQRRTGDGGFDGGSVANTLHIDPSEPTSGACFPIGSMGVYSF